jgi:hypothetical protein
LRTHVLIEGPPGTVVREAALVIEFVELEHLIAAAVEASAVSDRIELCGGTGATDAARVIAAVGAAADVRVNRYGFESVEQAAAYKHAFTTGQGADAAFFYSTEVAVPRVEHPGAVIVGVADDKSLAIAARSALQRGVGIIELHGGLGASGAAVVRIALDGAVPVGFVD